MQIEVHFTVDALRGDISHLERRLKNQVSDPKKYPVFHSHLLIARNYAQDGTFGDAHHVYLRQDGVYCQVGNHSFKGHNKPTRIS